MRKTGNRLLTIQEFEESLREMYGRPNKPACEMGICRITGECQFETLCGPKGFDLKDYHGCPSVIKGSSNVGINKEREGGR